MKYALTQIYVCYYVLFIKYTDSAVVQEYVAQLISKNYSDILGHVSNLKEATEQERVSKANWLTWLRIVNEGSVIYRVIILIYL